MSGSLSRCFKLSEFKLSFKTDFENRVHGAAYMEYALETSLPRRMAYCAKTVNVLLSLIRSEFINLAIFSKPASLIFFFISMWRCTTVRDSLYLIYPNITASVLRASMFKYKYNLNG